MAFQIGDHVVSGEVNNTRRNSVHGWLDFGDDQGIRLSLTGNCTGELAGKHLRFELPARDSLPSEFAADDLEFEQIGVVGTLEFLAAGEGREKSRLRLEWFGPNGPVACDLIDPEIEFLADDDEEDAEAAAADVSPDAADLPELDALDFLIDSSRDEAKSAAGDDAEPDDPYQLFPADLDERIAAGNSDDASDTDDDAEQDLFAGPDAPDAPAGGRRDWEEVIPGIDPETKRMYEQWDEMFDGKHDVPMSMIFDPPLQLPPADELTDDQAWAALQTLLARLALHRVALDICEHYTPRAAYRLLIEEIVPDSNIYPKLPAVGFVQHFSTSEYCPQCDAEFEARYEAEQRNAEPRPDPPPEDPPLTDDD